MVVSPIEKDLKGEGGKGVAKTSNDQAQNAAKASTSNLAGEQLARERTEESVGTENHADKGKGKESAGEAFVTQQQLKAMFAHQWEQIRLLLERQPN